MELLLALLSLLTAATGAVAGARAPESGVHQSANIVAVAPSRSVAPRLFTARDAGIARATEAVRAAIAIETPVAAPLYADRRLE